LLFDGGTVVGSFIPNPVSPLLTYLLTDYLKLVKTFLDQNPTEVVTLLFTNPDNLSLTEQWFPAFNDSGVADLAFVPPSLPVKRDDWPTLGDMIDEGKRVVVFMDANADPSQVDFILPEFDMVRSRS
jgi:hypothetical protein